VNGTFFYFCTEHTRKVVREKRKRERGGEREEKVHNTQKLRKSQEREYNGERGDKR